MSTTTQPRTARHSVASFLYREQLQATLWLFGLYLVGLAVIGALVAYFGAFDEEFGSSLVAGSVQIVQWFALAMGVYCTGIYLPIYVAHGKTRREIMSGSVTFCAGYAVFLAGLIAVAFALEAGVFQLLGWSDRLADPHPLGGLTAAAETLATVTGVFAVFLAVGMLCGAAFYREIGLGLLILVPAFAMVALAQGVTGLFRGMSESGTDPSRLGPIPLPELLTAPSDFVAALICLGLAVVAVALTWPIVRDIPLRPRST